MKSVFVLLSYILHPLFILTYALIILLAIDPFSFGSSTISEQLPLIVICFVYTVLFPLISMMVMKLIGFVDSLEMADRQERIGPLIITIVFYTWMYLNVRHNPGVPESFTVIALGSVFALGLAFLVNVFDKVSLHSVGIGGLVGFVALLIFTFDYEWINFGNHSIQLVTFLIALVLVAGAVGTSRLFLDAHKPPQIYGGLVIGVLGQLAAWRFLL